VIQSLRGHVEERALERFERLKEDIEREAASDYQR